MIHAKNLCTASAVLLCTLCLVQSAIAQSDSLRIDTVDVEKLKQKVRKALVQATASPVQQAEKPGVSFEVVPWEFHAPLMSEVTADDSTLRWQHWPDWTYKLNREPGVISYRLGTSLRSNAVQKYAHEPRHQELYWEDIMLNDPVSGTVYWPLIPQHRISNFYEQDLGSGYRSVYFLRQYYLNRPLSRLIYSESKFTTRKLDFEVSHNVSQRTNLELSYWDRRDGGEYPNSAVAGRQIFGRVTHHLDEYRLIKLNYTSDKYDLGQPFGYVINDMRTFHFDRFATTAAQSGAETTQKASLLALNFYQRDAGDGDYATDDLHAGLFYRSRGRMLDYTADSTAYTIRSVGTNIRKWHSLGDIELEGGASAEFFFNGTAGTGNLFFDDWSLMRGEAKVSIPVGGGITLEADSEYRYRSDGFSSFRLNVAPEFRLGRFTVRTGASAGSRMPEMQQLYWQSESYRGDTGLVNELVRDLRGSLRYDIIPGINFGVRGQHKDVNRGIMVGTDSTFINVNPYASQSVTAFLNADTEHIEFSGSADMHRFTDNFATPAAAIPMSPRERIWLKGSLYWKGYLFNRATYVKAGLAGMFSPFRYQADSYNPVLDYWQPISGDQFLPQYSRLDLDISARVRSLVFVIRWENILNEVTHQGYFETARYPMSQRRFIFGVRALFRD